MHSSDLHCVYFFILFPAENVLVLHHRGNIFLLDYVLEPTHPKQEEYVKLFYFTLCLEIYAFIMGFHDISTVI